MFSVFSQLSKLVRNLRTTISDRLGFFANIERRRLALAAENLFLRKQLALFREREKKALPTGFVAHNDVSAPDSSRSRTGLASSLEDLVSRLARDSEFSA